jgi:hypothetical protein
VDDEGGDGRRAPGARGRELHERQERAHEEDRRPLVLGHAGEPPHALADLRVRPRLAQPVAQVGRDLGQVELRVLLGHRAQAGLPGHLRVGGVLVARDEVQRRAVDRRLDDLARGERRLEVLAREGVHAGGEADVGRPPLLPLQRREAADRLGGADPRGRQQVLAGGERRGELAAGQGPLGRHRREDATGAAC